MNNAGNHLAYDKSTETVNVTVKSYNGNTFPASLSGYHHMSFLKWKKLFLCHVQHYKREIATGLFHAAQHAWRELC